MTPAEDSAAAPAQPIRWRAGAGAAVAARRLAVETAVALIHDASTTAVMMASPTELDDLGLGFSLTEGVIEAASDIERLEVRQGPDGFEVQMWLAADRSRDLTLRRRRLAGPTGCGLCGIESLAEARRMPQPVTADLRLSPDQVQAAVTALAAAQELNRETRAVHAAGFWTPDQGLVCSREDVGRHNALDKVVGALARQAVAPSGVVVLTSRVSVEMVQKCAALGAPVLVAVSAPTTLAVERADALGVTLIGIARDDGFEIFTHSRRIG